MDPAEKPASSLDERRTRERRPSRAPLRVRLETQAFAGVCDNVSETGVFLTSGARLRVTVELDDPDGGRRVLSGHLVRVQRMSADSTGYAIELERG
jgi:hypothetical protein